MFDMEKEKTGRLKESKMDSEKAGVETKELDPIEQKMVIFKLLLEFCLKEKFMQILPFLISRFLKMGERLGFGDLKDILKSESEDPRFWFYCSKRFVKERKYQEAIFCLENALKFDGSTISVVRTTFEDQEKALTNVLEISYKSLKYEIYCCLTALHSALGNHDKVIEYGEEALKIEPLDDIYHLLMKSYADMQLENFWDLARDFMKKKEYKKAVELLELLVKDGSGQFWSMLAHCYIIMGNFESAISALKKKIKLNGDDEEDYILLSIIYDVVGNRLNAKKYLAKARKLNPQAESKRNEWEKYYLKEIEMYGR